MKLWLPKGTKYSPISSESTPIETRPRLPVDQARSSTSEEGRIMNFSTLGFLLLGVWLVASGALPLIGVHSSFAPMVMEVLAIVSGILIIIGQKPTRSWWR